MKQYLDLKVDLENPDEARHTIDELVKAYEADKCKWAEGEIANAQLMAMRIMNRLCFDGSDINWCDVGEASGLHSISVWLESEEGERRNCNCFLSPCLWNVWIAKCVCLCRATGREVPAFIVKKAGECW